MALRAGTVFAGYTIERVLGRGGMGVVYLARQPRLQRSIALKVLDVDPATDSKAREAFNREAALAASLEHPNIVAVHDRSGPDDPALWLAIRYVGGGDAGALLSTAPYGLDPLRAVRLATDCAHALDFAHGHNVLHRDVKPANLLIEHDPRHGERALLTDFGIARALDGRSTDTAVSATFAYVAPERFTSGPTDHRADQYSLGCTFYHLLTGRYPFPHQDQAALIAAHLNEPPPAPSENRPDLPLALDAVIATALAKEPDQRFATCVDFATAAAQALDGPGTRTARSAPAAGPPSRSLSRRRLLIGGAVAVPVAGAATALVVDRLTAASAHTDGTPAEGGAPTEHHAPIRNIVFSGHDREVDAVACSPQGTRIASSSRDSTVMLWDAELGGPSRAVLRQHSDEVHSVAFSPDGTRLASGGADTTIMVHDVRAVRSEPSVFRGHDGSVWSVAFEPGGARLASGGKDGTVRLWDVGTGVQTRDPLRSSHGGEVWSVAFNRAGTLLASGGMDRIVRLWNVDDLGASPRLLEGHEGEIWSVAFHPDGTLLASGGSDSAVRVWDVRTGEARLFSTDRPDAGWSVAFSPDGSLLAAGNPYGTVRLWNVRTGELDRPPLGPHPSRVPSVAFGPEGDFLVSGCEDAKVRVWAL